MTGSHNLANMGVSTGLGKARHNPADVESFEKFRTSLLSKYDRLSKEREREAALRNVRSWVEGLPPRWKDANLNTIEVESVTVEKVCESISRGVRSFYIVGNAGAGKTFLAYAILRRLIGIGEVSPSRILVISEPDILRYVRAGFDGQKEIEKILSRQYDVILFDDAGSKKTYNDSYDTPILGLFFSRIYNNNTSVIVTSSLPVERYGSMLGEQTEARLENMFLDNRASCVVGIGDVRMESFAHVKQQDYEKGFVLTERENVREK